MWYEALNFSSWVELWKNVHCRKSVQIIDWFFVGGRILFEVGK